jgi:hypothetical protein
MEKANASAMRPPTDRVVLRDKITPLPGERLYRKALSYVKAGTRPPADRRRLTASLRHGSLIIGQSTNGV